MTHNRAKQRQFFSIEEANAMLPLIRAIVSDLAELSSDLIERKKRLSYLLVGRNQNSHDPYQEELIQIEQELEKDTRRLHDYREELRALGVESENSPDGFVDFPALFDGHKVYFCWKLGDGEVLFWHEPDADCAQRHHLTADSVAEGTPEGDFQEQ
jgi:hypothetical protein